jgi:ribosome biogenesis protein UTP30
MEEEEIVDNVMAAVEAAVEKVPKKWANVRALHLKAVDSVALPIYQVVPELGMKIEVPENVGSGVVIDAAEAETRGKKIDKKKANAGASGRVIFGNISAKRKRNKKEQIEEDVVMQEEVQVETEKKKRKSTAVSADDSQKVDKKNKEKGKRGLENEVKEASLDNKKIKKGKTEEGKKKKKSMKGDGEVGTDEIREDKKIKGEKSDGKTKKLRTRVRV